MYSVSSHGEDRRRHAWFANDRERREVDGRVAPGRPRPGGHGAPRGSSVARRVTLGACRRNHDGSKKWDRRPTADPFSERLDRAHRRNRRTSGMHATSDALVWHYSDRLLGFCRYWSQIRPAPGSLGWSALSVHIAT